MEDKILSKDDNLLLRLMDRYKPHLKPYAYRLHTWSQVLDEYNRTTGSRYRQIRTLKKKFEKLTEACEGQEEPIHAGNIELLQKLIRESNQISGRSHSQHRKPQQANGASSPKTKIRPERKLSLEEHITYGSSKILESSDSREFHSNQQQQPPPLDSITIGYPHSQSRRDSRVSTTSSASQPSAAAAAAAASYGTPSLNALGADAETSASPSQKKTPLDERLNTQLLTNLLGVISNHYSFLKPSPHNISSPMSFPPAELPQNALTLERLYSEFKHYQHSQEAFQQEVIYRLDLISAELAQKSHLEPKYSMPHDGDHYESADTNKPYSSTEEGNDQHHQSLD